VKKEITASQEELTMRISLATVAVAAIVLAVGAAVPASAQCPAVPNGTFASDVSGWTNFATWDGSLGNPVGSDQVGPVNAGGSTTCGDSLSACLPVTPGDNCTLSAQAYVPTGQPTSGLGELSYLFFSDGSCSTFLSQSSVASVPGSQQGTWVALNTGAVTIPAGAQSARVALNVCAAANTSMTVNWDNVVSAAQEAIPTLGTKALVLFGALLALTGLVALRGLRG
jgi:hypothetical protein